MQNPLLGWRLRAFAYAAFALILRICLFIYLIFVLVFVFFLLSLPGFDVVQFSHSSCKGGLCGNLPVEHQRDENLITKQINMFV
jgi:hypothetical protein